jgi:hypothetical protein
MHYSSRLSPSGKNRVFPAFFVYVVAANIPLWVASHSLGLLVKGLFNVEFVIIGILSVFLRRSLTVGLLVIAVLLDLLSAVCMTYMLSASDLVRSGRGLFEFAPSHLWAIASVTLCVVAVCLMAVSAGNDRSAESGRGYVVAMLAVFAVSCVAVDLGTGQVRILQPDRQLGSLRLTRSSISSIRTMESRQRAFRRLVSAGTNASVVSASRMVVGFEAGSRSLPTNAMLPNLVIVLVESWGKPLTADLDESLIRPYAAKDLAEKYTLSRGTVPFYGPTVDGEARELCGSAIGFGLLSASASQMKGCLPAKLGVMGYHSTGVHGFSSRMFDRREWYSTMGFDETWFRGRLEGQGLPLCPGPFPGICDAAVSVWIGDRLQKKSDSPQFIYWVTLNSHLPVPVPNLVKAPPSCSGIAITAENPAMCSWYQLVFNVHRAVAELAMRSTGRPTIYVIVGDHAPPFSSSRLRSQFSDEVVPYVLLIPKRENSQATRPSVVAAQTPAGTRRPHDKSTKTISRSPTAG